MAEDDAVRVGRDVGEALELADIRSAQRAQSLLIVGLAAALAALVGILIARGVLELPDVLGRFRG